MLAIAKSSKLAKMLHKAIHERGISVYAL